MVELIFSCPSCGYILVVSVRFSGMLKFNCNKCNFTWFKSSHENEFCIGLGWKQKLDKIIERLGKDNFIEWLSKEYGKPIQNR